MESTQPSCNVDAVVGGTFSKTAQKTVQKRPKNCPILGIFGKRPGRQGLFPRGLLLPRCQVTTLLLALCDFRRLMPPFLRPPLAFPEAEAVKVGMQTRFESFVKCDEQPWPDSGGPSNIFIPPHAVSGGKTTQTPSFQGLGPNSSQQPASKSFVRFKGSRVRGLHQGVRKFLGGLQRGSGVPDCVGERERERKREREREIKKEREKEREREREKEREKEREREVVGTRVYDF